MRPSGRAVRRAVVGCAVATRVALLAWAIPRFPPAEDGVFYHTVASRIAAGLGYTWQWPDGVVTYAAHYPVGYPALLGLAYAAVGSHPAVAMVVNAVLGVIAAAAAYQVALPTSGVRGAGLAGLIVALHPSLLAYTPALMTEAIAGDLLVSAAALALWAAAARRRRWAWWAVGVLGGLACLIRPQLVLLVPALGLLSVEAVAWRTRLGRALLVGGVALACCVPWTLRNCHRMERCVFVSANGGWNLLIGTASEAEGGWRSIDQLGVPPECRTEFREAHKDRCFGAAGLRRIRASPGAWLGLIPAKLRQTFDLPGAPGAYLAASNGAAFGERGKLALGGLELLAQRLLYLGVLWASARVPGPRQRWRRWLAGAGALTFLGPWAWVGLLLAALNVAWLGARVVRSPALLFGAIAVVETALVHAGFFGAARYALVLTPLLAAMAVARHEAVGAPALTGPASVCDTGEKEFEDAARRV